MRGLMGPCGSTPRPAHPARPPSAGPGTAARPAAAPPPRCCCCAAVACPAWRRPAGGRAAHRRARLRRGTPRHSRAPQAAACRSPRRPARSAGRTRAGREARSSPPAPAPAGRRPARGQLGSSHDGRLAAAAAAAAANPRPLAARQLDAASWMREQRTTLPCTQDTPISSVSGSPAASTMAAGGSASSPLAPRDARHRTPPARSRSARCRSHLARRPPRHRSRSRAAAASARARLRDAGCAVGPTGRPPRLLRLPAAAARAPK
jgi:hypothetical protein